MSRNGVNIYKSLKKQLTTFWGNGNLYPVLVETGNYEYKRDDVELRMQMNIQPLTLSSPQKQRKNGLKMSIQMKKNYSNLKEKTQQITTQFA